MKAAIQALRWLNGELWILDQRKLPGRTVWIRARSVETVARAIETLAVRGAPVIGIAAAYGVALAARRGTTPEILKLAIDRLARTRPTGRNLFEALDRLTAVVDQGGKDLAQRIERKAVQLHRHDARSCLAMARYGLSLLGRKECILTYCNTGALATGGIGTALGVIKHGYARGKIVEVYACETRPVLQGARLTIWECDKAGIPATLICDNMAGALMRSGRITRVMVGADRIAQNGDTSNKIGTCGLALMAHECRIPFHVVAPISTFDTRLRSGRQIIIEERDHQEVLRIVPDLRRLKNIRIWNPAFDVTPACYIASFITDRGVLHPPFDF